MTTDDTLEDFWAEVGHEPRRAEPSLAAVTSFPDSQAPELGSAYRLTQELIERIQENDIPDTLFWLGLLSVEGNELLTIRQGIDIAEGARSRTLEFTVSFAIERPGVAAYFGVWPTVIGGELLVTCPFHAGPVPVELGASVHGRCVLVL